MDDLAISKRDLALESLLTVKKNLSVKITDDLLRKIYEIERKNQFNKETNISMEEIRKFIEGNFE